jgi:poly(glycerol-phosphate) alpha-glucosyltransferase
MRIVHIVHGKANPTGHNGISRVVYHLNKQEKLQGVDSEIWALVDDAKSHYTHKRDEFVTVECFPRVRLPFGSHEIIDHLISEKDSIALVHFHLIWFYDKNIIAKALRKSGVPFIITTHGTYSTRHAYTGKRLLAKWFYELGYLNLATEVHALSREEGTGLQRYGYRGRSFVVPNGIELGEIPSKRRNDFFASKPYRDKLKLIWIGVLREDKNLRALIGAVALLPAAIRDQLVCILIGPDYKGNSKKFLILAQELGCAKNFDLVGPLYDQQKYDAIESADIYVLPSFTEGVSLAMLDAMACAKPCLITTGCGFNYFIKDDFFILCEPYARDIASGIQEAVQRRSDWPQMGRRGRLAIEHRFNWSSIAQVMVANYSRIVKGIT